MWSETKENKKINLMALIFLGFMIPLSVNAELAIVVNADNDIDTITLDQVADIFLGRSKQLPNGIKVIPLDLLEGQETRNSFYSQVVKKSQPQLNSYWSRQIFTGKGHPPFAVGNADEMIEFIAFNPNMIGYVNTKHLVYSPNSINIKVILTVPD